jgi:alpha-galactosidase
MTRSAVAVVVAALVALSMPAASNAQQRQPTSPPPSPPPPPPPLLAQTPPMGWNSYNKFGCNIDEGIIRAQADAMVLNISSAGNKSLRDLGYHLVMIDDCWMAPQRNAATGELEADPKRFPSGIAALADYVHARGLKFGIYSAPGPQTCSGRAYLQTSLGGRLPFYFPLFPPYPGSQGHEAQDADTFAAWGVDYLKYDRCSGSWDEAERAFALMRDSLAATGRPIVYSINPDENDFSRTSNKNSTKPDWMSGYAHLVRTTKDLDPAWRQLPWSQGFWSTGVVDAIDANGPLFAAAGPGHWNDPDMLQVGVKRPWLFGRKQVALTDVEGRTQFSMWAMMAAPLILGNDLTRMVEDDATRETLTNAEVIAIDQDPLGVQGRRVASSSSLGKFGGDSAEVWSKPLADGGFAVALLNRGKSPRVVRVEWSDVAFVGREGGEEAQRGSSQVRVRDVWRHADVGEFDVVGGSYSATVEAHGVVVLRVAFVQ